MKKIFLDIGLFISSYIPLYFLIIVKELIEIINGNLSFNITNSIMLALNFLLIIIGAITIFIIFNSKEFNQVEIIKYKNITCENFLPFFPLFVLFAIAFELEYISMAIVYILILIMIGIVYIKNDLFYINPFLNIIGFNSYLVTFKQGEKIIENKKLFCIKEPNFKHLHSNGLIIK